MPLNGKKNNLKNTDFIDYFGLKRLELNKNIITDIVEEIQQAIPSWQKLIRNNFLSLSMQEKYLNLLEKRSNQLGFE